jgi:Zn-dependent protease
VGAALTWVAIPALAASEALGSALYVVGFALAQTNLVLMFFNLIPIPPLDGSSVVPMFLPDSMLRGWYDLQRYAFPIFILLVFGLPFLGDLLGFPGFSPIGWYLGHTAIPVLDFLVPS